MFLEVTSLLNSCVEQTVILNDITQEKNKVLGDKINKNVKFRRLERSMEKAISTSQSVVEAGKQNGGPQQKLPLEENESPASRLNKEHGMIKDIKR